MKDKKLDFEEKGEFIWVKIVKKPKKEYIDGHGYKRKIRNVGEIQFQPIEVATALINDGIAKKTDEPFMQILKDPKLLGILVEEIHKKVVRETDTIKTIILFKCGELVENIEPTSYNLFLSEESGVGKDYVLARTLGLFPKEYQLHKAKITPELLAYWKNASNNPEWTWDRHSLYLEEISGSVLNSDMFVGFTSQRDYEGMVLINQKPVDLKIKGKPVIFITTASKNPKKDQLRRFAFASLDDSIDQTKAILRRQYEYAMKGEILEYNPEITKALRYLKRVKVRIPYAEKLGYAISKKFKFNKILRTTNIRFIDLIKSSTALHQYQRERDSEGFLLADFQDYEIAKEVFGKISHSASTVPITKDKKRLLNVMKKMGNGLHIVSEIEPKAPFLSKQSLYNYLKELADNDYLNIDTKELEDKVGRTRNIMAFEYSKYDKLIFPSVKDIESIESIERVETIESIETTTEPIDSIDSILSTESSVKKNKIEDSGYVKD